MLDPSPLLGVFYISGEFSCPEFELDGYKGPATVSILRFYHSNVLGFKHRAFSDNCFYLLFFPRYLLEYREAMFVRPASLLLLTLASAVPSLASSIPAILRVPDADWHALNASVDGRLRTLKPLAEPCYVWYNADGQFRPHAPDLEACRLAQDNRRNVDFISSHPAGYHDPFYASCMTEGRGCPLTSLPANASHQPLVATCYQGNVPDYYIDVRKVSDIQAGLKFAEAHDIPLVVKNTGHDYRGRSAGAHSLALWYDNSFPSLSYGPFGI